MCLSPEPTRFANEAARVHHCSRRRGGNLAARGTRTAADIFRHSASYVDRILKGANPAELPAQAPAKFEFAINLKTATTLGLTVPPTVIALADEVIRPRSRV
jgi:ABC-type uncharacterized transport system substrate-binding protein